MTDGAHFQSANFALPYLSFGELFWARISGKADEEFLAYYDAGGLRTAFSYQEFGKLVGQTMRVMQDLGLQQGQVLGIMAYNHWETVLIYFAGWCSGLVVAPINVEEPLSRKVFILENSEAKVLFTAPEYVQEAMEMQRQVSSVQHVVAMGQDVAGHLPHLRTLTEAASQVCRIPDVGLEDPAFIVYTSGTTGLPKGVLLNHRNLLVDADGIADWHGFQKDDVLMNVLPIHHVNGTIVTLITPLYFGGKIILNRRFSPARFWELVSRERVKCVSVVPTLLEFLLEADENISAYDLSYFRGVICGAGPLLVETALNFERRFGFPIIHGYGLSETTCYSCFLPVDLSTEHQRYWLSEFGFPSIGAPIKHNEMAILGPDGRLLEQMERGEIAIRGATVMPGYYRRVDANAAAFRDGWFLSGDEGFYKLDERTGRKFFFITGRIKELIIRGGVNISPLEIDDVLRLHPKVKYGMTIPFQNRYYGEEIAAYVVPLDSTVTAEEILDHCRVKLPFFKQPKVILFGQEVPYTSTGKPKRLQLAADLKEQLAPYKNYQFKK